MTILRLPLALLAIMILMTIANEAQAQQRVIVEHHYPAGVTHIPGQGGGRTYVTGGHYGPSTCYRECFHQGPTVIVQQPTTVIVQPGYRVRPRSGFSIGGSYQQYNGGGSGFSIGGSYHDYR